MDASLDDIEERIKSVSAITKTVMDRLTKVYSICKL